MESELSQGEIKKIILDLERKYPVETWKLNSIDLWPYIRIKLYLFLLNLNDLRLEKKELQKLRGDNSAFRGPMRIFKKVLDLPSSIFVYSSFLNSLQKKELIFFGAHFHRTQVEGVLFNRFFDPMIDAHRLHENIYFIEYEKVFSNFFNPSAIIPLHKYLKPFKFLMKFGGIISSRKKAKVDNDLRDYDLFYEDLLNNFPEAILLKLGQNDLNKWANKVQMAKGFFLKLYKKVRPKKLLFLSYYGYDDLAAAIVAGHELNIPIIDFQHGPQTNVHMAYSCWTKHPFVEYNTMPTEYWNWDVESKENLESWIKNRPQIQAKLTGHPFMAYCRIKSDGLAPRERIFFSLQTLNLEEMLPSDILEIVRNSDLLWVFRIHPRSNFSVDHLREFLTFNKVNDDRYIIESAGKIPLPQSLAEAKVHITNFSGCVLEARMLGVPSIIIHESGKEMFKDYFDERLVLYSKLEELEENINSLIQTDSVSYTGVSEEIINPLQ